MTKNQYFFFQHPKDLPFPSFFPSFKHSTTSILKEVKIILYIIMPFFERKKICFTEFIFLKKKNGKEILLIQIFWK